MPHARWPGLYTESPGSTPIKKYAMIYVDVPIEGIPFSFHNVLLPSRRIEPYDGFRRGFAKKCGPSQLLENKLVGVG